MDGITTLTPELIALLRRDGQHVYETGQRPAAPALSPTWHEICKGKRVGEATDLLRRAADEFHTGYSLAAQGLAPLVDLFDRTERDYDVENTGGYVMALVVRVLDGTVWTITGDDTGLYEDDPHARLYTVCRYLDVAWDSEDSNEPETADHGCTAEDVVALLDFTRTGHPFQ